MNQKFISTFSDSMQMNKWLVSRRYWKSPSCIQCVFQLENSILGQWTNPEGQPAPPRPTCTNHDDGETNAVIQCSACGNLCADCDRFLHLHRKTRHHQRQVWFMNVKDKLYNSAESIFVKRMVKNATIFTFFAVLLTFCRIVRFILCCHFVELSH